MSNRIFPILALAAAVALFFFYVNPAWSGSIATAKAAIASDDTALEAANQYVAQQNQLASARNAIDPANLTRLEAFLPDSVNNVGIILDLDTLAAHTGLALSNIDVAANPAQASSAASALPAGGANPVGSVDLSLSAIGTYAALENFLSGIERSKRLLDVRALSMKGSDTGVYNYQITVRLYWLR